MINNYISNGMRAEPGEFPFFCALCLSDSADIDRHRCGSVLINKRWVLSAAHCIENIDVAKLSVYVGMEHYNPGAIYQDKVKIKQIICHPYWRNPPSDPDVICPPPFNVPYDIALLELTRETISNDFASINGINKHLDLPEGTGVIAIGMGDTELGKTSEYLRKTIISIANPKRCIEVPSGYPPACHKPALHICAIGNNTTIQGGDSGSPLLANDGNNTVVGLVSRRVMQSMEFTRVSYYSDWILKNINK